MITKQIAHEVSRQTGFTPAEAVRELRLLVRDIQRQLRTGGSVQLPGFGLLVIGVSGRIRFCKERR